MSKQRPHYNLHKEVSQYDSFWYCQNAELFRS